MKALFALMLSFISTLSAAATVALATGDDYAPFTHSQLPGGGMATELVKAALEAQGHTTDVRFKQWSRAMDEAKDGKAAGTFPWFSTKERQADFLFSEPIYEMREYAFIKAGSKLDFAKLDSLEGTTICLPTGWAAPPAITDLIAAKKINKAESRDGSGCLRMVFSGRADYFITDLFQARETMKIGNLEEGSVVASKAVLSVRPLYLLAAQNQAASADLIKSFNAGLQAIKTNGTYNKIIAKYVK